MFTISVVRIGPKVLTITIDSPELTRMPIIRRVFLPLEPGDDVDVAWGLWKRGALLGGWSFDGNATEPTAQKPPNCSDCELLPWCADDPRNDDHCPWLRRLDRSAAKIWDENKATTRKENGKHENDNIWLSMWTKLFGKK